MTAHPATRRSWQLWVDLETTGLDPHEDFLLEAAAWLIDDEGRPAAGLQVLNLEAVPVASTEGKTMADHLHDLMGGFVFNMHIRSGLIDSLIAHRVRPALDLPALPRPEPRPEWQLRVVDTETEADEALQAWLARQLPDGVRPVLCGSGIGHFDLPWMAVNSWGLPAMCEYWTIDVGVVRRCFAHVGLTIPAPDSTGETKTHRAVNDVIAHRLEWLQYQAAMRTLALLVHQWQQ